ncbi:uncharacterized protein BDR25DRAFT_304469 [Lindgomyces ingoldianus]|uniref:Uncharacterized protein n=1 Tax=Lindgomyces ingoldianus TaxID=673940 RepID=A0ACB6QQS6_9PLEO|nr:uncharacterized protein BDR25DRAFT_304469 [Lindgomyces ingoldianus]KAF2469344.1 hypothetical protein BDR25DRAFT_304469 [Lindgomyces ingoldianus]
MPSPSLPQGSPQPHTTTTPATLNPITPFFFEQYPPATATISSPLFHLPRETRDQIYANLFSSSRYQCREGNLDAIYGYRSPSNSTGLPRWILACKQLLSEALTEFYRGARCVHGDGGTPKHTPTTLSPYSLISLHRVRRLEFGYDESTPIPLNFAPGIRKTDHSGAVVTIPAIDPSEANIPNIRQLSEQLRATVHEVRELRFQLQLPDSWKFAWVEDVLTWRVDMSGFEKLGEGFERVEFVVETPVIDAERDGPNAVQGVAIVYGLLQRELERVGRRLVGFCSTNDNGEDERQNYAIKDWLDTSSHQHWHISIQRTPDRTSNRTISFPGLRKWITPEGLRHYERVGEQVDGLVTFCAASWGTTIEVDVPTDGRRPIPAETGYPRNSFCPDPAVEKELIQWGVL